MFFDTHAHYDDPRFDSDRHTLLPKIHADCVDLIVNSGESRKAVHAGVALAHQYPFLYTAVGIHPHYAKDMTEEDLELLRSTALTEDKVVAIGEIGLDYHYDTSPRRLQRYWFDEQLGLAEQLNLPVIIHSREAAQECFDMIAQSKVRQGVIHCYSGSVEMAKQYVEMGFYLGIGGVLTYNNAKKLVEVVQQIDLSRLVLETDCPYLAPVPCRGQRNDSSLLKYVAEKMAAIKGLSIEEIAAQTKQNGLDLFFGGKNPLS